MPTVLELRDLAKKKGVKGYSTMKKAELEKVLSPSKKASGKIAKSKPKSKKPKMSSKKSEKISRWMVINLSTEDNDFIIGAFDTKAQAIACAISTYKSFFTLSNKKGEKLIRDLIINGRLGDRDFGIGIEHWTDKKQTVQVSPQILNLLHEIQ